MGASGDHWFVPWGWYSSSNSRVSGVPSAPTCCRCEVLSAPDKDSQPGLHSTAQSAHRCCSAAAAAKALNSGSGRGVEVVMERCLGFHGLSGRFGGGLPAWKTSCCSTNPETVPESSPPTGHHDQPLSFPDQTA